MLSRRAQGLALACLVIASPSPLRAQTPAELTLPDGRTVEVLGLRRWSLAMLQDSLARYAPGDSLQTHSCAGALRYKLGFADAAATTYVLRPDLPARVVVSVREPQDSSRVRYRVLPMDTTRGRVEWRAVTEVMRTAPAAFWPAVDAYVKRAAALPQLRTAADSAAALSALEFLKARTAERDRLAAHAALLRSPNVFDRATAALILYNFRGRDDTWRALAETLRESDGLARSVASTVLLELAYSSPRPVDWTPAAAGINAMLDGTSLFGVPTLIEVLTRTSVGPPQARAFLRGGGEMILAYLGSGTTMLSSPAHKLLIQLRGSDLGDAPGPWRSWIAGL